MLTRLEVRNFKLFEQVEIELAERVVFVGPNNSGKTSALQALALWGAGVRRWAEKRGGGNTPKERSGVTINRRDLIALPVPSSKLLWRDLHVREGYKDGGKQKTRNLLIEIDVTGIDRGQAWTTCLEFDYANEESFYCRSRVDPQTGERHEVSPAAAEVQLAYLPPMSGLAATERRLDEGAIGVLIGEGRTAEVLRNLCWQVWSNSADQWKRIAERMRALFGVQVDEPRYIKERGEVIMTFKTSRGTDLDLSASGRGQQQTLLLLAHMAAHPGSVLLLDEPDAHLEVFRQRQIYEVLSETASETGGQIIAASHSEVLLNEAADRDTVIAFVGRPHRIDDRKSQVLKALKEIGFDQYLLAEEAGWVLYLEGATDLAILRAFAARLSHPAREVLQQPFVKYVGNQPKDAQHHFYGLREAKPDLRGLAIYDRLVTTPPADPNLRQEVWRRREIENYLCTEKTLLAWAEAKGREQDYEIFADAWRKGMKEVIDRVSGALSLLSKPSPWGPDLKVSEEFLAPVFRDFYSLQNLENLMHKTNFHTLAVHVPRDELDAEVCEKLDAVAHVAGVAGGVAPHSQRPHQ